MKNKNPLVSIIVPIYGVEKYLKKCINSILEQSYLNLEIILVDDGSKDKSPTICDEFEKIDNRIKVLHKENGGLVSARKAGVENANGEYIQFVDGDDWIEKEMVATLVQKALDSQVDIVMCNYYEVRKYKNKHNLLIKEGIYEKKIYKQYISSHSLFGGSSNPHFKFGIEPVVWNKLFKRDILVYFEKQIPNVISYGEDVACTMPILLNSSSMAVIDQCLYNYRIHSESMSKAYNENQTIDTIYLINYLKEVYGKNEDLECQLAYYHVSITLSDFCNECRKGIDRAFIRRYKKLKRYLKETEFRLSLEKLDFKKFNIKNKMILFLIQKRLYFAVYFIIVIAILKEEENG